MPNHKEVGVVTIPDGVWHMDSHYWRKFIGGVHKIQILIREFLEIGGVRGTQTPY